MDPGQIYALLMYLLENMHGVLQASESPNLKQRHTRITQRDAQNTTATRGMMVQLQAAQEPATRKPGNDTLTTGRHQHTHKHQVINQDSCRSGTCSITRVCWLALVSLQQWWTICAFYRKQEDSSSFVAKPTPDKLATGQLGDQSPGLSARYSYQVKSLSPGTHTDLASVAYSTICGKAARMSCSRCQAPFNNTVLHIAAHSPVSPPGPCKRQNSMAACIICITHMQCIRHGLQSVACNKATCHTTCR